MEQLIPNECAWKEALKPIKGTNFLSAEVPTRSSLFSEAEIQSELQEMIIEFILLGRRRGRPRKDGGFDEEK